ncbi:integrase, catalytic region, zinc finger, CCHC-type containing protein [Tanacetum coccineum]
MSSSNKRNHVSLCNANFKNAVKDANSKFVCSTCNGCLFSTNPDKCVVTYINNVNKRVKSKSGKSKKMEWKPTDKVVQIIIWYLDSRCSKHMTGQRSQLINFVEKFLGTVRFGNDHIAKIIRYGDYQIRNVTISRVYYMERLGHNLFSVGQFCDSDLEVAFQKHTFFVRNLEGVDLLTSSKDTNLYTLSLADMMRSSPIYLLSKASKTKSWLWHRRKSKNHTHKPKSKDSIQEKLYLLHMDLCRPIRIESINGKKNIRTNNGTEFVNQTLKSYYEDVRISHQTSVSRTPQQNDVVERQNQTLVEVARTTLISSKAPLYLWAEAVATACYTQNRSLIHKRPNKTPYELLHDRKPDLKYLHIFGSLCYPTNDSKDLGKLKPKADIGISISYAPAKKAYRIYNRQTRQIMEIIHIDFDELTIMASEQSSSGPTPHEMTPGTIIRVAAAPTLADLTSSPSSTSIDQAAPSTKSSSTVQPTNLPFDHISKWTKNHPLENVIGNPSRPVSTRKQLQTDAMWCFFNAFLTSVEPKNFKEAMLESSWIDAMQEEIHE